MIDDRSIAVVIPAYDEAPRIAATLRSVPAYVDRILVVDDGSADGTADVARAVPDDRVSVLTLAHNRGVGAAIAHGYVACLEEQVDVAVVIGGDGQMHPGDMLALVRTVLDGRADYAKGNRLLRGEGWRSMPLARLVGTLVLSVGTMLATGYYGSFDSQCGYTAISGSALARLPLERLFPRYGYPNDLLVLLSRIRATVRDVPVRILYGPGTSKMKVRRVILPLMSILGRGVVGRVGLR